MCSGQVCQKRGYNGLIVAHTHREKNIGIAVALNIGFTIIEIIGGLLTNSVAILADALHDFGDSISLITSYILERQSRRPADAKRTFGYARLSLLSAFIAALVLIGGSLFILSQAIPRLLNPEEVYAPGMIALAIVGVLFNGVAFLRLKKGSSLNEKVISWHMLDDVLGWSTILIGSIAIQIWNLPILDPLMTIGFITFTLWGVGKNLKESLNIFLEGVPAHINVEAIKSDLLSIDGVKAVHDVHVWSLEGETDLFTGHVVVSESLLQDINRTRKDIKQRLSKHHIEHSTVEFEGEQECDGVCEGEENHAN